MYGLYTVPRRGGRGVHVGCGASKARIFKGKCDFQTKGKGVADVMQKNATGVSRSLNNISYKRPLKV